MSLRIVNDNAADAAIIGASTTAGALTTANLKTEIKSEVWRSTSTSATLTLTWNEARSISMFALIFTNLTATAKFRVRAYTSVGDANPILDSPLGLVAAPQPLGMWNWGMQDLGVNAFAYGGGSYGVRWFDAVHVQRLVVDIADPDNAASYIEAARCVCGAHWTPRHGGVYGTQWKLVDATKVERSEAGDRHAEIGSRHRWLSVDLARLTPSDRSFLMGMVRAGGIAKPFFLSVFARKDDDPMAEQQYQLWGALPETQAIVHPSFQAYSKQLIVEEM